jgi:uncharacterized protein (DUF2235 family)
MAKRLVVCCDGTWNRPDQLDHGIAAPTNVSKLALAIARKGDDGVEQTVFYERGVGTRRWERLRGGAFGMGLSRNVQDCYRFLVTNYEPDDELFFLGFSRGAFTARSTVGFVRNGGIMRPEHVDRIGEAYDLYRSRGDRTHPNGIAAEMFRRMYSHPDTDIHFVGVWDTVGALGIPVDGFRPPLLSRMWSFHDTRLSRSVRHAYHAVAIDERRRPFQPTLWECRPDAGDQVLEQVWFAGVHCDVGGGYRDPELSEIPLLWMAGKARDCGLAFKPDHLVMAEPGFDAVARRAGRCVNPSATGPIHESRTRFYRLFPPYDRELSCDGGTVAASARDRFEADPAYRPPRLDRWLADGERPITPVPAATT